MATKKSQKKPIPQKKDKLTDKERIFAEHYVEYRSAKRAAIAAGYAESSADQSGARLLRSDRVKIYVEKLLAQARKRQAVSHDRIIERWMKIADITIEDVATFAVTVIDGKKNKPLLIIKPIDEWSDAAKEHLWIDQDVKALKVGKDQYQVVPVQKVLPPNKERALIEIGKLLGFYTDLNTSIQHLKLYGINIIQGEDGQLVVGKVSPMP